MSALNRRVIDHAALSGSFQPVRFLYGAEDRVEEALSALAPLCHEVIVNGDVHWRMRNAERTRVLKRLVAAPDRHGRLIRKRGPLKGDVFAQVLDMCLRGKKVPVLKDLPVPEAGDASRMYREAISATIAAQSVVDPARRTALGKFENALYRASVEQAERARRRVILPGKLCGREGERAEVLNFLKDVHSDEDQITFFDNPTPRGPRSLLVLGTPGLGKSAFLTDVAERIAKTRPKPWVLKFDFDQMTLLHGNVIAWSEEATRQLGQQVPKAAKDLSTLRRDLAAERTGSSGDADQSYAHQIVTQSQGILANLKAQPLVILVDTIEELVARDMRDMFRDSPMRTVFYQFIEWVEQIGGVNGALPTHVIYSGRIAPPLAEGTLADWFNAQLMLSDLSDPAAEELLGLRDPNMTKATRAALVKALGGHPLHLIIAQKHLNSLPKK